MTIPYEDRVISTEQRNLIELRVLHSKVDPLEQLERMFQTYVTEQRSNEKPILGRHVRKFVPSNPNLPEVRTIRTPSPTNKARLADALKLASVPTVAKVLQDIYTDAYDGDDADSSERLADLTDGARASANRLINYLDSDGAPDVDALAERTANDAVTSGGFASDLDDIESSGGNTWTFEAEDDACDECADMDGQTFSLDDDGIIPVHPSCGCGVAQ